jgi:uncharacterized protein (TIGR00290 family)
MHSKKRTTLLSWSSGKDSAWALHVLRQQPDIEVVGLFSTINQAFDRVAMHAVRREPVQRQADSAGLPLHVIAIPHPCDNREYEQAMMCFIDMANRRGIECFAFGDLFLEDVRHYREEKMQGSGITPIFPLWGMPTQEISREMVRSGLRATLTCVDPRHLPRDFAGREFNDALLNDLPEGVDPCGEYGEFHSFAFAGPMFQRPIAIRVGEVVERDGFVFADVSVC